MRPIQIIALASVSAVLIAAGVGCSNQDQIAANQTSQSQTGHPITNGELTKRRQATIQQHKAE